MIYLLRHGLDDENFVGGWSNVDLTNEGIDQVNKVAALIKDLEIKKIYSSDVKRAITTSNIINSYLNVPIEYTPLLREQNKGDANGMDREIANVRYKEFMESIDVDKKYPNGESLRDLYNRINKLIDIIKDYDKVLLITHRGVINMFYYILNDVSLDMDKKRFGVTHASLHCLNLKEGSIKKIF